MIKIGLDFDVKKNKNNFMKNTFLVIVYLNILLIYMGSSELNAQVIAAPSIKASTEKLDLSDFRGSVYLDDKFQQGTIYDELTGQEKNKWVRYNVLDDVFEIKQTENSTNVEVLKKTYEIYVEIKDKKFYFRNYIDKEGNNITGYVEKIAESKDNEFSIKYAKELIMPQKAQTSLEQDLPGKIKDDSYYLVGKGNGLKPAEIDKKNIYTFFSKEKMAALKAYVKEHRLKFRDTDDIKKLVNYSESL